MKPGAVTVFLILLLPFFSSGQISPGKLTAVHAHLEGISNCTQCHTLGDKVTNDKCLACHTELKSRIDLNLGYHASAEIKGHNCTKCHSDHHGVNFQIIRFDKDKFNHQLTGYPLTGAHTSRQCTDCHKKQFITDNRLKNKKFTYLGLNRQCVTCHEDYHQKTLSQQCGDCHSDRSFKPATGFSHDRSKFRLAGSHREVACEKCHKITTRDGKKFQEFKGVPFQGCVSCHSDPHQNRFGQNCAQCHTEVSFHVIKNSSEFDHSKTRFPLTGKHTQVSCKSCHKSGISAAIKFARCTDCHTDYHQGQFGTGPGSSDCLECHTTAGFQGSAYTVERHNQASFRLEGAHLATPCIACHKKNGQWTFRQIGIQCADCHTDIHSGHISPDYYPGKNCRTCHNSSSWADVSFDHENTGFRLSDVHRKKSCRDCHFTTDQKGTLVQRFAAMDGSCNQCHTDNHAGQFDRGGVTDCLRCHEENLWKIDRFDHDRTAFKLDGSHQNVPCQKCHKQVTENNRTFILYKIKEWKCENCH
jgi:hypothetical protein